MKVRRFLFTKNPGQKQRDELFLLNVPPSCPKNPGQEKMNVRHFVLPKRLDKKKMKVQHFFAYQKSWTDKRGEFCFGLMSHLVAPKILNKFWTRKKWTWGIFLLNAPTSHQNNPGEKKWRCNIFLLTKNPGQRGQRSWNKKGVIFVCLVSHLIAPKSWTRKNKGAFFCLPKILE